MKRMILIGTLALAAAAVAVPLTWAGSPHFVGPISAVISGDNGETLTVSGKEAGLGNEEQVDIRVTATAACINPGGNKPQAANKETFSAEGQFPVQNGKALFSLTLTASFQPNCSPPMTIQWSEIVVTDLTHGISRAL